MNEISTHTQHNFRQGDFCYHEFKLKEIVRMNGNLITALSDGRYRMSSGFGFNDRCFPLDMNVKLISESMMAFYLKFTSIKTKMDIPRLHEYLIRAWVEMCHNRNDPAFVQSYWKKIEAAYEQLLKAVNEDLSIKELLYYE